MMSSSIIGPHTYISHFDKSFLKLCRNTETCRCESGLRGSMSIVRARLFYGAER